MESKEERAKIFIIDDEMININILVSFLRPNYRIVSAKSGLQALQRIQSHPLPDLILLDINMPDMSGYEVCEKLKGDIRTRDIPIIFVTSNSSEESETRGFEVGAVDYIVKPYHPSIVMARVKTHIELKRRGDMLERMAVLDGLTAIPNRRRFDQFLDYEWVRSLRYGHSFALLLMDIDYFKLFNDNYGHSEGDDVLRQVAGCIASSMPRTADLAARYGGEEFACILPETNKAGARIAAERVLQAIRALEIPHAFSKSAGHVTLSIGIASIIPTVKQRTLDLITMADQALYQAKQNGRNQAVCFEEPSTCEGETP
ncbi:MAG: diguanylate cyclase [Magnetococcales bacterium]|nr:diguanylate cyclase [Magnetococcales bacterium]MBF0438235.1 diguanylate cyclase [Magnetococcales bacterium]